MAGILLLVEEAIRFHAHLSCVLKLPSYTQLASLGRFPSIIQAAGLKADLESL